MVLVDDLDRCLPDAVTATLEAIKLFLSTEKMVFVLAADQDMVRDAISVSLDGARRGDIFAQRYLEKIVQLPIALPRLSAADAEAYIGLLIAGRSMEESDLQRHGGYRPHGVTPAAGASCCVVNPSWTSKGHRDFTCPPTNRHAP